MTEPKARKKKTRIRVTLDWIVGCTLLLLGLLGFILPILQGWIFVLAGLAVLGSHSRRIDRLNRWIRAWVNRVRKRLFRRRKQVAPIPGPVPVVPSVPRPQAAAPEEAGWTASRRC